MRVAGGSRRREGETNLKIGDCCSLHCTQAYDVEICNGRFVQTMNPVATTSYFKSLSHVSLVIGS